MISAITKYTLLTIVLISSLLFSQNKVDSLLSILDEFKDNSRVNLLNEISVAYFQLEQNAEASKYSNKAFELAAELGYNKGKIDAYNNLGRINLSLREVSKALEFANKAIILSKKVGDKKAEAKALRSFGNASLYLGEKDTAIVKLKKALSIYNQLDDSLSVGIIFSDLGEAYTYLNDSPKMVTTYLHALEIFEKLGNQERIAITHLNLGSVYSNLLGEYQKAIKHADAALKIYDKFGDEVRKTYCYLIIGSAHEYLGNLDLALEQYNKSLEICKKTNNQYLLANTENYIGEVHNKKGNIKSALESYNKSLDIYLELNDKEGIAVAENNIGECFYKSGELGKALKHYRNSFNYFNERQEKFQLSELLLNMGNVYFKRKNYNSAINAYNQSIQYAKETGALESLKEAYKATSEAYKGINMHASALNYLELYVEIKDSLINVENLAMLADYESRQKTAEKEKKIELLKKEQELSEVNVRLQSILIISLVIITLLLIATVVIYFRKYRQKHILNEKLAQSEVHLQKLNITKDKFFSLIAHDLRGPLGTLSGLTEILDEDAEDMDKESIVEISKDIHQISRNTITLLNNLLAWAEVQIGKIEISKENFKVKYVVDEVHGLLKENLNKKHITFSNDINEDIIVHADKNMISSVLRNLIHNSIKFTHEKGEILVHSNENNGFISISVADNGVGIDEDSIDKLFEIGTKVSTYGTARESGAGLGLILSKEFIDKNNGTIEVKSKIGDGTTFIINLPHSVN